MAELAKAPKIDEEIAKLLKTVRDQFEKEDRATREWQVRRYKKLKLYWNNMTQIYWSESAQDYRIAAANYLSADDNQAYYDRPVNVFRAFLETIIAALSIQIPAICCVPDDANNPMDLSTAKAGDKIAQKLYKQNDVIFLWLQAFYIYCTEGMVACYHYPKEDEKFGTYQKKIFKDQPTETYVCPACHSELSDELFTPPTVGFEDTLEPEMPEAAPEEMEADMLNIPQIVCPDCGAPLDPAMPKVPSVKSVFDRMETKPKSSICQEMYGGLYVRIANYAREQCDTPYLRFAYETHYANVVERYEHLFGKFGDSNSSAGLASRDPYEQSARLNPQYAGKFPDNNVTVENWWFRPAAFNVLPKEQADILKKKFADGVKTVFINELCADYEEECMDDRWTLTRNPLSDYMTHEPLGELLVNIQDIVNDLISLTIQTIEHGVIQTWADPSVVNFDGQNQLEAVPGSITATKAVPGKNISDAFYASQAATLNPEVFSFYRIIQELGQFVSGAMPSIFGGAQIGKTSGTASEYAMSKGMALQRLQTPWRMFTMWWKQIFNKVIPMYMDEMVEDERFVQKDKQNRFINIFIKKAELGGKIGDVDLEASEQLPISDDQKSELIMNLMNLNNMEVMQALIAPENIEWLRKVTRIVDFKLPGEDDRQKQLEEIDQMLDSAPIPGMGDPLTGMMGMPTSSVEIDPDVDNHEVQAEICRSWLVSESGRAAKIENPNGYMNILLHFKAHLQIVQMNAMAQQAAQAPQQEQTNTNKPPDNSGKSGKKVTGEKNAEVPIH